MYKLINIIKSYFYEIFKNIYSFILFIIKLTSFISVSIFILLYMGVSVDVRMWYINIVILFISCIIYSIHSIKNQHYNNE